MALLGDVCRGLLSVAVGFQFADWTQVFLPKAALYLAAPASEQTVNKLGELAH